jgi:hypothetical protein
VFQLCSVWASTAYLSTNGMVREGCFGRVGVGACGCGCVWGCGFVWECVHVCVCVCGGGGGGGWVGMGVGGGRVGGEGEGRGRGGGGGGMRFVKRESWTTCRLPNLSLKKSARIPWSSSCALDAACCLRIVTISSGFSEKAPAVIGLVSAMRRGTAEGGALNPSGPSLGG